MGVPLVALGYRPPPEQPGPLEMYKQAVQLKSLLAAQQMLPLQMEAERQRIALGQQQQQVGQLQLQQAQYDIGRQQAVNAAYHDALETDDQGNVTVNQGKLANYLAKANYGASIPDVQKHYADYQKSQMDLQEAQGKVDDHTRNAAGSLGAMIHASGDDPALADLEIERHLRTPNLPQSEAARFKDIRSQIAANPGLIKTIADNLIAQSPQQQQLGLEAAKANKTQESVVMGSDGQPHKVSVTTDPKGNIVSRQDLGVAYEALNPQLLSMKDWLAKNPGKGPSDYEVYMKRIVPAFNFSLQQQAGMSAVTPELSNLHGEDYLNAALAQGKINPGEAGTVRAIAEGRIPVPSGFVMKTPYGQRIMGALNQYDSQFNTQRAELRKKLTTSPEVNAINTGLGHAGVLYDAIDALNNNDTLALNHLANFLNVQTGATPVTTFQTIVNRVGPEIAKAYVGAGGTGKERGTTEADFSPNLSPQQLKGNVAITVDLLRSKISSLENQWDQTRKGAPGMPSFQDRFIMPEAQQVLNRIGARAAPAPAGGGAQIPPGSRPVVQNGKTIGYTTDGKHMIVLP